MVDVVDLIILDSSAISGFARAETLEKTTKLTDARL